MLAHQQQSYKEWRILISCTVATQPNSQPGDPVRYVIETVVTKPGTFRINFGNALSGSVDLDASQKTYASDDEAHAAALQEAKAAIDAEEAGLHQR